MVRIKYQEAARLEVKLGRPGSFPHRVTDPGQEEGIE